MSEPRVLTKEEVESWHVVAANEEGLEPENMGRIPWPEVLALVATIRDRERQRDEARNSAMVVSAPFDDFTVKRINAYQERGDTHPLTCGNDSRHEVLRATEICLVCPNCEYRQNWVPRAIFGIADALDMAALRESLRQSQAECAALREALSRCGQHEWDCNAVLKRDDGECDCPMRALTGTGSLVADVVRDGLRMAEALDQRGDVSEGSDEGQAITASVRALLESPGGGVWK